MDPITQFVESLAQQAGLNILPPDVAQTHKDQLYQNVMERIGAITMSSLSDDAAKEYIDLIAKNADQKTLSEFLAKNIANYEQLIAQGLEEFKNSYLATFNKA